MRYVILVCLIMLLAVVPVLAQQTCPALVQQALEALGNNCAALDRNTACYGYNRLQATFSEPVADDFFVQVTDRAGLTQMQTLQTYPMDTASGEWGIGVMNVQANVPNTLPGQAVTFLLLGDSQVENDVAPDEAFQPVDPVDVTNSSIANLRGAPDFNAPTVLTLPAGTTLPADGRSADEVFLRVVYQAQVLWVDAAAVTGPEALNELPVIRDDSLTPMQAFYFTTGVGEPGCSEAPSLVAINSPENLHIDLSVNGAQINVGSLITFQTTEDGGVMTVIEGGVRNEDGLVIPAGQASDLELDEDNNIVDWGDPRPITPDEFTAGQVVQQAMFNLENPIVAVGGVCNPGQTTTHTVAAGENLFRIAIRYNSTVADIAALNNITDVRTIFVGQVLQIPCGSNTSGQSPMAGINQPPVTNPINQTPIPGTNVCSTLRQTSPLGGYPNGATPFYWDGVATATSYNVLIYNDQGALVRTFATQGNQTTVTGDMSANSVGQGTNFTWMVQALVNGQVICSTPGLTLPRDQFAQGGGGTTVPGPSLSLTCPGSTSLILNWSNVNPGSTISWNITSPFIINGSTTSAGTSGTQFLTTPSPTQTYSGTAASSSPAASQNVSVFCP